MPRFTKAKRPPVSYLRRLIHANNTEGLKTFPLSRFPKNCRQVLGDALDACPETFSLVLAKVVAIAKKRRMDVADFRCSMFGGMYAAVRRENVPALRQLITAATGLKLNLKFAHWDCLLGAAGLHDHGDAFSVLLAVLVEPGRTLCAPDQTECMLRLALAKVCEWSSRTTTIKKVLRLCEVWRVPIHTYKLLRGVLDRGLVQAARLLTDYKYAEPEDAAFLATSAATPPPEISGEFVRAGGGGHPMESALQASPAVLAAVLRTLPWARDFVAHNPKWCLEYAVYFMDTKFNPKVMQGRTFRVLLDAAEASHWAPFIPDVLRLACEAKNAYFLVGLLRYCDLKALRQTNAAVVEEIRAVAARGLFPGYWEVLELLDSE
jgi:hypothetical protein